MSPELCFVVEEGNEIVGYALGALNAKQFYQKLKAAWIPEMCNKYPEKLDPIDESNVSIPQVRSLGVCFFSNEKTCSRCVFNLFFLVSGNDSLVPFVQRRGYFPRGYSKSTSFRDVRNPLKFGLRSIHRETCDYLFVSCFESKWYWFDLFICRRTG